MMKRHIKKGDIVFVNSGNYKGKKGKVLEIITKKNRAIVEGVNLVSKHMRPDNDNPQGGIIKKEAPIHISNLNIVDPKTGEPTRVGRKIVEENGKKRIIKYAKKSEEEIK